MTNSNEHEPEVKSTPESEHESAPDSTPDPAQQPEPKPEYVPFEPFNPYIRRTEATFVPQESKIYVPPVHDGR